VFGVPLGNFLQHGGYLGVFGILGSQLLEKSTNLPFFIFGIGARYDGRQVNIPWFNA